MLRKYDLCPESCFQYDNNADGESVFDWSKTNLCDDFNKKNVWFLMMHIHRRSMCTLDAVVYSTVNLFQKWIQDLIT